MSGLTPQIFQIFEYNGCRAHCLFRRFCAQTTFYVVRTTMTGGLYLRDLNLTVNEGHSRRAENKSKQM